MGNHLFNQETLKNAKTVLMKKVEAEAELLGANVVLALRVNYSEISGNRKSMVLVSATGTTVSVGKIKELK
ncbi:heavy metal-binding domain-containing protein [Fusobacterium sp.]|uniref:heavy metal-binding domain-containing protein n=1 Tax=Fusobacterium sp. TaxID=68766 RepID=UPI0029029820|nr:heavy metal-binding domain-containing protein [Fusobacterium sp.]MDU1911506.1 heavy metal-binding domain-containing protein [Fusobacterium sp.]